MKEAFRAKLVGSYLHFIGWIDENLRNEVAASGGSAWGGECL